MRIFQKICQITCRIFIPALFLVVLVYYLNLPRNPTLALEIMISVWTFLSLLGMPDDEKNK